MQPAASAAYATPTPARTLPSCPAGARKRMQARAPSAQSSLQLRSWPPAAAVVAAGAGRVSEGRGCCARECANPPLAPAHRPAQRQHTRLHTHGGDHAHRHGVLEGGVVVAPPCAEEGRHQLPRERTHACRSAGGKTRLLHHHHHLFLPRDAASVAFSNLDSG